MTLGEKIAKQRKAQNLTQEQLAEILGVSRQSVSKWESDTAYPETGKLIKIGELFGCSMDYLLKENRMEPEYRETPLEPLKVTVNPRSLIQLPEKTSQRTICGIPLYQTGKNARGFFAFGINARGVFAAGVKAKGIVSFGVLSTGVLSFGVLSLGLLAFGAFTVGVLSFGAISLGIIALGAISIGIISVGAVSIGCFSTGALAVGKYAAIGERAHAMVAWGTGTANGSLYSNVAPLSGGDFTLFQTNLHEIVPSWLKWAQTLFTTFL